MADRNIHIHILKGRHRYTQTERQADRQTDRQREDTDLKVKKFQCKFSNQISISLVSYNGDNLHNDSCLSVYLQNLRHSSLPRTTLPSGKSTASEY